jgi:hypothetical protein
MRIDEFAAAADGALSGRDLVRYSCLGFDLPSAINLAASIVQVSVVQALLAGTTPLAATLSAATAVTATLARAPATDAPSVLLLGQ